MAGIKALLEEVGAEDAGAILAGKMSPPLEGSFGPLKGERVKKAAVAMDAATERLNAAIEAAETKLFAMNLGVTATVPFDSESDNDNAHWETFLRFGKDGREWRLIVYTVDERGDESESPLLSCSRKTRINSLKILPDLFVAVVEEAERQAKELDREVSGFLQAIGVN